MHYGHYWYTRVLFRRKCDVMVAMATDVHAIIEWHDWGVLWSTMIERSTLKYSLPSKCVWSCLVEVFFDHVYLGQINSDWGMDK